MGLGYDFGCNASLVRVRKLYHLCEDGYMMKKKLAFQSAELCMQLGAVHKVQIF